MRSDILNKTVYVNSYFKAVGKIVDVKVPTGEKKTGFFGDEKDITKIEQRWEQTGSSDCEIDGQRLADDIQTAVQTLNSEGYSVTSITPVTSGRYNYEYKDKGQYGGYSYGYGYSITEGMVIIGQKLT
jgi:hypothetical protein